MEEYFSHKLILFFKHIQYFSHLVKLNARRGEVYEKRREDRILILFSSIYILNCILLVLLLLLLLFLLSNSQTF